MEDQVSTLDNGVAVLRLDGRLDMASADLLRRRIGSLVEQGHTRIAIDLSGVGFLDSSGLGALISGLKTTRSAGGDLRIAGPNDQAKLVLSLTGLERVLPAHADAEHAFD